MINAVCVRVGTLYGPEYVEILADMVRRNASNEDVAFWCVTDDPDSLPEGVNYIPHNPALKGWWQKPYLFSRDMPWAEGDRIAYFDLDIAVTGRLEDLPKGIIQDWHWPCYNSSVMVWDHGEHREVWRRFELQPEMVDRPGGIVPPELLPKGQINGGDQEWMTQLGGWETFPPGLFVSYRDCKGWPPTDCRAVIFHGKPKPHECGGWVPNVWKVNGFTSLPKMDGSNVSREQTLANMRANCERDLPWFSGFGERKGNVVLVCGGPSMKKNIQAIKDHKRRGAKIVTVNNAHRYLMANGLTPDVHVMLDARPDNVAFVEDAPHGVKYLISSQCDHSVFDALAGHDVVLWHNGAGDQDEQWAIVNRPDKPCILVPGGGTVGLRALWLCHFSGYRAIHVYGMDSSYAEDGTHHSYAQPLNEGEDTMTVAVGEKRYRCAKWMVRQAEEFKETWHDLKEAGTTVFVHGTGLVPDLFRILRSEAA